jgi:hypothetical protein
VLAKPALPQKVSQNFRLGNVAYRAEGGFDWDAKNLKATGNAQASDYIRTAYREGWQV